VEGALWILKLSRKEKIFVKRKKDQRILIVEALGGTSQVAT
jgi:hypothetical protein